MKTHKRPKLKRVVQVGSTIALFTDDRSVRATGMASGRFWKLTLECGHEIEPYAKNAKPPKRAKCWYCMDDE